MRAAARRFVSVEGAATLLPPASPEDFAGMRADGTGPPYFTSEEGQVVYWIDELEEWAARRDRFINAP